ncbi:MAG: hypothetical protein ONB30_02345 [candidate division KSB1 bacterium]|nr:hypothetical protein [candidate division KSB1 bacterium]
MMCHTCSGRGRIGEFEFEVHGTDAEDVERVTKTLLQQGLQKISSNSKVEIHLHHSTLGVLNTGEIENVHSISVNVSTLSDSGFPEVANALKILTEAIADSQEIASAQRAELLEQIEELSSQAARKPGERTKAGVIKAILTSLATTLSAAGGLAEVWSTWGPVVTRFFGF